MNRMALITCWPRKLNGRLNIFSSFSFPNATMLPQKVTAPMIAVAAVAVSITCTLTPSPAPRVNSAPATNTDAAPPKPLNAPTNCGIAVIWILNAKNPPSSAPAMAPVMMYSKRITLTNVTMTASSMASDPSRLPRTAVRGWAMSFKPTMNRIAATT